MPRVKCVNCEGRLALKLASYKLKGASVLCYMCRRNPPEEYKCLVPTHSGKPCQNIKVFNSATCGHHKEGSK
jgi:hypothetical protein